MKEDGEGDEDDGEEDARAGSAYVTAGGARKLSAELARLWKVERPRVTQEVADAAAQGDRSENAEYIYGKKRLREIDRRIRYLRQRLEAVTVVEPSPQQEGKAYFGAWVTVEDDDGNESTYRIVGSDELDLARGWISMESPLAKALLGKKLDDEVTVMRPKGPKEYTIVAIRYREE